MTESQSVREKKDGKIWTHFEPWYRFVDPFEHLKDYGIIKHMRTVSEEEMKEREEVKKKKGEERKVRIEKIKAVRAKKGLPRKRPEVT